MKKAILIVNVGTPDSPDVRDVGMFLSRFLNDPHVINIPRLWRKILVDWLIVPFRASKSAALYRQLWTENGSPLRFYLERVRDELQERFGDRIDVRAAMNYGKPDISDVLDEMQAKGYRQITVVPLFPQYAVSTTGSTESLVAKHIARWSVQPKLNIVRKFYDHPLFIDAWVDRIAAYLPERYEHVVFSFHGLPLNHLPPECRSETVECKCIRSGNFSSIYDKSECCYKAACYCTAEWLAERLGLRPTGHTVAFQSRMSNCWIRPFTDEVLKKLASEGSKVLIVAPSFVADCLETNIELGTQYKESFLKNGGLEYTLVESLNDGPKWIEALVEIGDSSDHPD